MKVTERKNKVHISIETEEDIVSLNKFNNINIIQDIITNKLFTTIEFKETVKYPKEEFYRILKGE